MPDLRNEIENAAKALNVPPSYFRNVGPLPWKHISSQVAYQFLVRGELQIANTWWWECMKAPVSALHVSSGEGHRFLTLLAPPNEQAWLFAEETLNEQSKKWVFEGRVREFQQILGECYLFEYYIVSKRGEWLVAENHHNVLFAAGSAIDRMSKLDPIGITSIKTDSGASPSDATDD